MAKQQTALQKSNSSYNQASSETISNMEKDTKNETDILTDQESNAEQKEIVDEAKEAAEEYEKQATRSLFEDQFAVRKARIIKKKKVTGTDLDRLVKFIEENNMQNKKGYTKKALLSKIAGWKNISWKEVIQAAKDASSYPKAKYRLPLTYNNKAFNAAFKEVFLFNSTEGTREWRAKVKRMKKYQSYNTGGYTGEWSDGSRDGRLAMLHQKELVLNANDTQHILDAVDIVRDIVETLKGSSLTSSLGTLSSGRYFNNSNNPIEQRVSIEATFPNATSADEIERALLSLSDSAFQYAYKTRD